ncbi:MAG: serine hydrolase domain-containing protein [Bacteroidota bacterium]
MKKIATYFIILFVFIVIHSKAQQTDSITYALDSAFAVSPFFGNVLITHHGKIIFEKSYGYADAVLKKPLTNKHSFQLASVSKQFTAYGIMLLKNRGLLEYDHLVRKYLPAFPYDNITIRHLLNHSSGLPDFWDKIRPNMDTLKSFGNKEVLTYLIDHKLPLQFVPGTQLEYCDIGYDFLANIIEQVSGLSYDVFSNKYIFRPLKMKGTFAYKVTDIERINNKNLAIGHVYKNNKFDYAHLQPNYHFVFYLGDFYGDGSLVSTARDLAKWDRALKHCTLLSCELQQEAFQPTKLKDSILYIWENVGYGFGWMMKESPSGRMVYHTGSHPGNAHAIYRFPDKDLTLIFLSNAETANVRKVRARVLDLVSHF